MQNIPRAGKAFNQKLRSNKLSIKKTNPPCYQFDFAQWDLQEKVIFERALCRVNHANSGGKEPKIHMESRLIFKKATCLRGLWFPLRKPWFHQVGKDQHQMSYGEDDPAQQDLHLISAQAEDFEGGGTDSSVIPSSIPASHPSGFTHSCVDCGVARQSWGLLCHT